MNASPEDLRRGFESLYEAVYDDLLRFVQRRCDPHRAEDVVAEAMLVAWRRVDQLPTELDQARAWTFGIARNCLLAENRVARRQDALSVRLAQTPPIHGGLHDGGDLIARRLDLARAWDGLRAGEQEVIALNVLDGLDSRAAGAVLGISADAYRLRLSRARRVLRRRLEGAATDDAPDYEEASS
ncbi:RNA polymerase sigma factor [Gephyromycinifex aptenodytis]|uniref:RNA polymerase sigma factor n=1 Tax=Gephyromycinifex aptenodytis TaxID=2716227 RepID=UPI001444AB4E|nr:sigma-70 family RNA polymerase sigma factor [Gephyromycinifex aptenodytis]